ncbi:ABC transporter ATP-binding protein [Carnobacteriaceae bacterium zg-ZUI252]|nr:ABC transporter ATP-binding protein [Carnobacteriaceae bacterium zg-ZUI252]MBS4769930.1 ABC transporter ATP-binding protein [Carnobacteriaceae bacterium zg-ZUI240]
MQLVLRLLRQLSVVKYYFLLGIVLQLLNTSMIQVSTLFIQGMIDNVLTPITQTGEMNTQLLWQQLGVFFAFVVGSFIIGYFANVVLQDCAARVVEHLRNQAYDKMQQLPISYFDNMPAGKVSSRIVNDTETLRTQFYNTLITQLSFSVFVSLVIYIVVFSINVWLGAVLLLLLPIMFLWQHIYTKKVDKELAIYYESQSQINTHVNETMNGSTILQLFKQEDAMSEEFERITSEMLRVQRRLVNVDAILSWNLMDVFKRIVIAIILAVVGYQVFGGAVGISAGVLFAMVNYTDRLFNSVGMIVRVLPNIQRTLATGKRLFELLDEPSETDSQTPLVVTNGNVVFNNVSFGYTPNHKVLKNISIEAKEGQTIALVGHTGSGKSSIINLLFRFYDPQEGEILIDGQNIALYNRESVREKMGIVLQDPYLFSGTIASNVAMDDDMMTREVIVESLEAVGATILLNKLPNGIDEPVVEKGNTFSSGERQLISFARTLASNPKILILDEATSHIDTQTEEIIQNAMNVVKKGRTTFIIAHRLSTIQSADMILVLHEGEIVERGNHQELLALNGRYAEMYRMQAKV